MYPRSRGKTYRYRFIAGHTYGDPSDLGYSSENATIMERVFEGTLDEVTAAFEDFSRRALAAGLGSASKQQYSHEKEVEEKAASLDYARFKANQAAGRAPNPRTSTDKKTGTYLVDGVGTIVVNEGYTFNDEYEVHPGANLAGAYLAEADLRGAKLDFANLTNASLRETDLRGASLVGADLTRADLTGANLQGADLRTATMPDGTIYSGRIPNPGQGSRRGPRGYKY